MEKASEFTIQDVQAILKTSERLNKHKDEIKRFLKIIDGFLTESGELDDFSTSQGLASGSMFTEVKFNREPLQNYSCGLWCFRDSHRLTMRIRARLYYAGIGQTTMDIYSDNIDGLSRHLVPIFYLALPEILEALVGLFPKLGENIQELIQISNMTQ